MKHWLVPLAFLLLTACDRSAAPVTPTRCPVATPPAGGMAEPASAVPVLVYHDIAPERSENPMVVSVRDFEAQMAWVSREGYYTPTLEELHAFVEGRGALPAKSVVVTFDDGYRSNYLHAHPVLCKYGLRAVLFKIGDRGHWFDLAAKPHLTWGQIQEMAGSGVWSVESHTYYGHDRIRGIAPLRIWNREQIEDDAERVSRAWADHGLPAPRAVAYPFGVYDDEVLEGMRRAGMQLGFTVESGYVRPGQDPMRLPRLGVFSYHTFDQFQGLVRTQ